MENLEWINIHSSFLEGGIMLDTFINGIMNNYSHFFSISDIISTLSNPANWGIILSLVLLEGLLSSDNALVLAILVNHLPGHQRKKALLYGIGGAYFFRFLAIGLGTYLIKIWWIKVLGGGYLLYLSFKYFKEKYHEEEKEEMKSIQKGLFATIIAVELMDITFSIDSITAAFGVSEKIWVLFLGGIFGIAMMRGVANLFIKLINNIPELENTAYILITIVGIRMVAAVMGYQFGDIIFFSALIATFIGTILYHYIKKPMLTKVNISTQIDHKEKEKIGDEI